MIKREIISRKNLLYMADKAKRRTSMRLIFGVPIAEYIRLLRGFDFEIKF